MSSLLQAAKDALRFFEELSCYRYDGELVNTDNIILQLSYAIVEHEKKVGELYKPSNLTREDLEEAAIAAGFELNSANLSKVLRFADAITTIRSRT